MRPASAVVMAVVASAVTACTGPGPGVDDPPPAENVESVLYVAVGASETVGVGTIEPLRQAWPQVLFRTGFPAGATMVNLGIPGATVATALQSELPHALALQPDVVTVWLNINDLVAGVSPETYEEQLDLLVGRLRRGNATTVLVANTPPLDGLPLYVACRPLAPQPGGGCDRNRRLPERVVDAAVAAYNDAIERVVSRHGAELVDLQAVVLDARGEGSEATLYAEDGFHPSVAGHRLAAEAFARALAAADA